MASGPDSGPIRILHLSDFHFSEERVWDADPVLWDLAGAVGKDTAGGLVPDFVAITGDLAFSGSKAEYKLAWEWLEQQFWPALGIDLPRDRLLLVPGNHDVDRTQIDFMADAAQSRLLETADQSAIAEILGKPDPRQAFIKRHSAYLAFCDRWFGGSPDTPWWQRRFNIREHPVYVAGLDSAWMSCGDQDQSRLLLGRWQLNQVIGTRESDTAGLSIALLHHPWSYFPDFDGGEAEELIHHKCDIVLRGHLHKPRGERLVPADPRRACLELAAGCVYENSRYPNAYQWLEIWPGEKVRVHFRVWHEQQWISDRNVPGAEDGQADFTLTPEAPPENKGRKRDEQRKDRALDVARGSPVLAEAEATQYRTWAQTRYQGVELIGVGDGELRLDFDQVYVPLAIARRDPLAEGEFDRRKASRHALAQEAALEELEVADIFRRAGRNQAHAAVFGIPGSGKTTVLLKLLHLCWRQEPGELGLAEDTLPLFLPLAQLDRKAMAEGRPLGPILGRGLELLAGPDLPKGLGERLWARGRLLLLLDGLDEVADERERARVAAYLAKALTTAGRRQVRALVSCRIDSYGGDVRLPGFLPLDVRPLDDPSIERFVAAWLGEAHRVRSGDPGLAKQDARRQTEQLIAALRGREYASQQLKTLVSNPLMLTLLCLVVLKGGRLPHNRGEFYRRCLDALLSSWGHAQGRDPCPLTEDGLVLAVLRPLARKLHRERRKYDLTPAQFLTVADRVLNPRGLQIQSAPLLDWLHREAGVVSEYAPRRYGFMHLGFQEYLCAESFGTADPDWLDELLPQLADDTGLDWWREVILLLAGLPDSAPFAKLVPPLLEPGAEQGSLLRACLVENPSLDLSPFLDVLDGQPGSSTQALVLELMTGRTDPELVERARALAGSAAAQVAQLAQRLLQRQLPVQEEEVWDLVLLHAPQDQPAADRLAAELRGRGLQPWLAAERLPEGRAWQDTQVLQELLELAIPVLVLAARGRPWDDPETLDALHLFAARNLTLLATGGSADAPPELPPVAAWLPRNQALPQALAAHLARRPQTPSRTRAGPRVGEPYTEPHTGIRLLWIPGGPFDMGSEQISNNEKPVHRVRLSPFRLAETPVTNGQYGLFLEASGHEEPSRWRDRRFFDPEQPVVGVSWHDAQAFCAWLAKLSDLPVTLPSEAQWEFAARGTDGRTYPWGNASPNPERACFDQDWQQGKPDPVGSHPAGRGPFGALDQAGNVWEWCLDVWDGRAYRKRSQTVPPDPMVTTGDDDQRVLRGGCWNYPAFYLQAAYRYWYPVGFRLDGIGFRVAVAPASLGP